MERDFVNGYDNTRIPASDAYDVGAGPLPVPLHPLSLGNSRIGATRDDLTPVEAVERFAKKISENLTKDYGDWMRDANFYWWELAASLREIPDIWDLMNGMHEVIQYAPDWKPIQTCRLSLELALELRERLGGLGNQQIRDYGLSATESDISEATEF